MDVKIQLTGVVDSSVSLPRVAEYGLSPYLVPNLPWDILLGHPWGYEHCLSHFARFNCLYSHHPVHPCFRIEDFHEAPRTGIPFLVKPIHGKVSPQSVWGITVPIIGAATPVQPAPAIVVTPPGGEPPNRVEAEKHISYALTASSMAPAQDRACALELVEFAPETLTRDVLPARRDGSVWKQSDYSLSPYWATSVKKLFGKSPDVDAFNRVPGMAQATRWASPLDGFFSTPTVPSTLYCMCPPYHRFSDCVWKIGQEKLRAIVVGPKCTHREWWEPLMELTLQGHDLPGPETKARVYQDDHLTPLHQRSWSTVALYVDGGTAEEHLGATKCHVASVLAPAVSNPVTYLSRPESVPPCLRKTNSTQRQGPGHAGPETKESQRHRWRTTRKRNKNGAPSGSDENRETQHGGGRAATTREQPAARRETQKRRERTESRKAGGQQNKQHTAPRPRARGAGNQRKPETTGAHNQEEKNKKRPEHKAAATKTARHNTGGGRGQQPPGSSQRPGRKHKKGESTWRAEKREANKTNSTHRQGPGHPGPENRESQRQQGRTTKKRRTKKNRSTERQRRKPREPNRGERGGSNNQEAPNGQAGTGKGARAHREGRSGRRTKQTAHSVKAQGTRAENQRKPETTGAQNEEEKRRKKENTSRGGRREEK